MILYFGALSVLYYNIKGNVAPSWDIKYQSRGAYSKIPGFIFCLFQSTPFTDQQCFIGPLLNAHGYKDPFPPPEGFLVRGRPRAGAGDPRRAIAGMHSAPSTLFYYTQGVPEHMKYQSNCFPEISNLRYALSQANLSLSPIGKVTHSLKMS